MERVGTSLAHFNAHTFMLDVRLTKEQAMQRGIVNAGIDISCTDHALMQKADRPQLIEQMVVREGIEPSALAL